MGLAKSDIVDYIGRVEGTSDETSAGSIWRSVENHMLSYKVAKARVYGYPPTTPRFRRVSRSSRLGGMGGVVGVFSWGRSVETLALKQLPTATNPLAP